MKNVWNRNFTAAQLVNAEGNGGIALPHFSKFKAAYPKSCEKCNYPVKKCRCFFLSEEHGSDNINVEEERFSVQVFTHLQGLSLKSNGILISLSLQFGHCVATV